ncbi:hypothetical protein [Marivirga arenosa]|uniref:Phosphate/sulfate permease n=1 Tax=Marivirga arenosa TaxID=3059076 RepID=A0AA51ZWT0_9BACT|nr:MULTISPECIES: hypothetical protein [unclassified Marivirga]WMN07544.1 hypothetical protein QYS48_09385 [Marivirga sp. ABR2-2]WNB18243.1 hypothetical protein QYS47_09220 [Marivirga sp. BKB1-2]
MAKKAFEKYNRSRVTEVTYRTFEIARREKAFITLIAVLTFLCGIFTPYPNIAMWIGFGIAAYSAIANDSIQTIGTFIASNSHRKWWILWLFMGLIFLATVTYSWVVYDGDVSHQRLASKGFNEAPETFSFLQLAAPVLLLILTRLRMPVSTSVLLLSAFSTQASSIGKVLSKSFSGYILAFVVAFIVWILVKKLVSKYFTSRKPAKFWTPLQWVTSGALWSIWIAQDAANIAVFLPRSLGIYEFIGFAGFIFIGLGVLFFLKGDRIQGIVNEKAGVTDVRAATLVDLIYAILLYYFKVISTIPISTTWVFIGLLGGRELAIALGKKRAKKRKKSSAKAGKLLGRDFLYATIGLILSLLLAFAINSDLREDVLESITSVF